MKAPIRICSLAAVGLTTLLTSCVDPYYSGYGGASTTTTVTHYRPGYVVDRIPGRYDTEVIGGTRYYRYDNVYYRPQGNRYVVVETPRGSRGWDNRNDRPYRYDNHRSDWDPRESGYDRRGPRPGYTETRVIRTLPSGYRTVTYRGTRYYQSGNVYYQSRGDGYVIVDRPY